MITIASIVAHFAHREWRGWRCGIALMLSMLPAAALACTPPPGGHPVYTIAQHVRVADVVLEGTITQVTVKHFQDYTATIAVQQYFKSSGPATVTITNFGTGADCRSVVKQGDAWIFFANGDPNAEMSASYLSAGDAISLPSADTVAQIIAALNSRPRAYLPLLFGGGANVAAATPSSADDSTPLGVALLLMILSVLSLRWLLR